MWIKHLRVTNFRNYTHIDLELPKAIHIFQGGNGQGKTSLLEAVHFLCLMRSFKTVHDVQAVRHGCTQFELEGEMVLDDFSSSPSPESRLRMVTLQGGGKVVFQDGKKANRLSALIGLYPVVSSSPEDLTIATGAPSERRRFLDQTMAQWSPVYLKDLQDYRQALRQRNALLPMPSVPADLLSSWNETLIQTGSRIISRRLAFIKAFSPVFRRLYGQLAEEAETVDIHYSSAVLSGIREHTGLEKEEMTIAEQYREKMKRHHPLDLQRQTTTIGPHKDDLEFYLNGHLLKSVGSQGQLKTFILALKLAEYLFLRDRMERHPVLLLDDVLSELDERRRGCLFEWLTEAHQVFMTSAEPLKNPETPLPMKAWMVRNGQVIPEA